MKRVVQILMVVLLAVLSAGAVRAEVAVSAELSSDRTSVGIPVLLQVRVEGSTNAQLPTSIAVDGLRIQQTGRSTQVQMMNFQMTTTAVYTYTVLPEQEGTFEIPAIDVTVGRQTFQTVGKTLTVEAGGANQRVPLPSTAAPALPGGRAAPDADDAAGAEERLAFAEMVIPRESVFVGEVVPVEIRFYFNKGYGFRLLQEEPTLSGEGFTVEDLSSPQRGEQVIGGTAYHVFSFQSAITAVKSGELEIPAVSLEALVQVPARGPAGFEDLFSQFFGGSGMPGFTDDRRITVTSEPTKLQVDSLPREGRPESFTGAIGDFTMDSTASPEAAAAGDPVKLKVLIAGRGNFSAMGEPELTQTEGWRLYPPSDTFEAADAVGFGGQKEFEFMMIAQEARTETPGVEFSYFDPTKAEYVTLTAEQIAVVAEAAAPESATGAAGGATAGESDADAGADEAETAAAVPEVAGRSGVLATHRERTFESPVRRVGFLVANGLALIAVVGLAVMLIARRIRSGAGAQRAAAMRRHRQLIAAMRRSGGEDEAFEAAALEDLDLLAERRGFVGAGAREALVEGAGGDDALRGLLARADERRFARGAALTLIDAGERRAIVEALEKAEGNLK